MKTKIGEIKSIRDFFKEVGERKRYNYSDDKSSYYEQEDMTWECKLCGEKFEIPSGRGMTQHSERFNPSITPLEEHIELHKLINDLGLTQQKLI